MLGKSVEWTSQSGGHVKKKTGTVVEVVRAGDRPNRMRFPDLYKGPGCGIGRNEESYVVAVQVGKRSTKHYWPRAGLLVAKG